MTDEELNLLRHDLLHMNLEELVAFGRAAERGSGEHIEAQAEFKRRRDREACESGAAAGSVLVGEEVAGISRPKNVRVYDVRGDCGAWKNR